MSKNTITILILMIPVGIWLNFYAYYKYGRQLINARKSKLRKDKEKHN